MIAGFSWFGLSPGKLSHLAESEESFHSEFVGRSSPGRRVVVLVSSKRSRGAILLVGARSVAAPGASSVSNSAFSTIRICRARRFQLANPVCRLPGKGSACHRSEVFGFCAPAMVSPYFIRVFQKAGTTTTMVRRR